MLMVRRRIVSVGLVRLRVVCRAHKACEHIVQLAALFHRGRQAVVMTGVHDAPAREPEPALAACDLEKPRLCHVPRAAIANMHLEVRRTHRSAFGGRV